MIDLDREARQVRQLEDRLKQNELACEREEAELGRATLRVGHAVQAQDVLQHLAQAVQQQAHERISRVVSSCLEAVFGDGAYEFQIQFERKRGKTEAQLRFVRGELNADPLSAAGGGAVDVASLALRVACVMLHRPRLSKVIILDEPLKYVSAEYRPNVRQMVEGLSRDLGFQIIMVTHAKDLVAGKVLEVG